MSPELKAKWLAALRSGTYKQGRNVLRDSKNNYCCLGVLCEVAGLKWDRDGKDKNYYCEAGQDYIENDVVMEELGLDEDNHRACFNLNDGTLSAKEALSWDTDKRPHTFAEIANWLEKRL